MFCSLCGAPNSEGRTSCQRCGAALPPLGDPAPAYAGPVQTSGKAIASLICGILFFLFPSALAAIILGHMSLSEIRRGGGRIAGRGMATTGLVLGYVGVAVIPFILIIAAIAIPNLLRARMAANEASTVGSLRIINTAEATYYSLYGNGFAPTLNELAGGGSSETCDHAQLIDTELASGAKTGYQFYYVPIDHLAAAGEGCALPGMKRYAVTANAITRGTTGQRSFFTDETGVIRVEENGYASAQSPPIR